MARAYSDALREAVARAVMSDAGFTYNGAGTLLEEAARGNPRVAAWVRTADAALDVVFPHLGAARRRA